MSETPTSPRRGRPGLSPADVAAGAARPHALRATLMFCCGLIFVGGLARFSALQPEVMFGPQLLGSVAAELIGMPLLALWLRALRA